MTISSIILHCKTCKKFICTLDFESLDLNSSNQLADLFLKLIYNLDIKVICGNCQKCMHEFAPLEDQSLEDLRWLMKSRQQYTLLVDTSGKNWYLVIKLPKPNKKSRQYKKHLKYLKAWRKRNKQRLMEYGRKYYKEHKQEFKQHYLSNREHILKRHKEYRKKNKAIISKKNRQRYLRRKNKKNSGS